MSVVRSPGWWRGSFVNRRNEVAGGVPTGARRVAFLFSNFVAVENVRVHRDLVGCPARGEVAAHQSGQVNFELVWARWSEHRPLKLRLDLSRPWRQAELREPKRRLLRVRKRVVRVVLDDRRGHLEKSAQFLDGKPARG